MTRRARVLAALDLTLRAGADPAHGGIDAAQARAAIKHLLGDEPLEAALDDLDQEPEGATPEDDDAEDELEVADTDAAADEDEATELGADEGASPWINGAEEINPRTKRPYSPNRWRNQETGQIRYSKTRPGAGRGGSRSAGGKLHPFELAEKIKGMLADKASLTVDSVSEALGMLASLTIPDIKTFGAQLGYTGKISGRKADLAARVRDSVLALARGETPAPAKRKAPARKAVASPQPKPEPAPEPEAPATADTPVPTATPKPDEVKAEVMDVVNDLLHNKHTATGLVPIHEVRQAIRERFGDAAASHKNFDEMLRQLWRAKKLRFTSIADHTEAGGKQNLQDAISGIGEVLFWVEPTEPKAPQKPRAAGKPTTPAAATPPPKKPPAVDKPHTPAQVRAAVVQHMNDLLAERHWDIDGGMVPIHEVRAAIREQYGPKAASPESFNEAVKQLWRDKKIRMVPITDTSDYTPEQLRDAIPGVGDTLFYIEPLQDAD